MRKKSGQRLAVSSQQDNNSPVRKAGDFVTPYAQFAICNSPSPVHPFTPSPVHRVRFLTLLLIVFALCAISGCGPIDEDLPTRYGQRVSGEGGVSINGTGVFGGMFEKAGHRVVSRRYLSPSFRESADVVVWFPDDFNGPKPEVRKWLNEWLAEEPGRTLIYVNRDFDAEPDYWRKVKPLTLPGQTKAVDDRITLADDRRRVQHQMVPDSEDNEWFQIRRGKHSPASTKAPPAESTAPVAGWRGPYAKDIDWTKAEIEIDSPIEMAGAHDILLERQRELVIGRRRVPAGDYGWAGDDANTSQIIVVVNGSFLVNSRLVNHEHRKLAGQLIDEVGPPTQRVVFLESEAGGPKVYQSDPVKQMENGLHLFSVWPLGPILLHLAAVGIIFCFARWPIFGLPRDPLKTGQGDFGQHLRALGELLSRTRDRAFAREKVSTFEAAAKADQPGWLKKSSSRKLS